MLIFSECKKGWNSCPVSSSKGYTPSIFKKKTMQKRHFLVLLCRNVYTTPKELNRLALFPIHRQKSYFIDRKCIKSEYFDCLQTTRNLNRCTHILKHQTPHVHYHWCHRPERFFMVRQTRFFELMVTSNWKKSLSLSLF